MNAIASTPTLLACSGCGAPIMRRTIRPDPKYMPYVVEELFCEHCGPLAEPERRDGRAQTHEWMKRSDAPLRIVVGFDGGSAGDGHGVTMKLECGHTLRLQRRDSRYDQKRARCPFCRDQADRT